MAIFHGLLRPRALDDAVHSGDNALNVLLMVLLVAFGVASWYFHANPLASHTGAGMAPSARRRLQDLAQAKTRSVRRRNWSRAPMICDQDRALATRKACACEGPSCAGFSLTQF